MTKSNTTTSRAWIKLLLPALLLVFMTGFLVIGWLASNRALIPNPEKVLYDQTVAAVNGQNYTISGSAYSVDGIVGGIRKDGSMIGIFSTPTVINATANTSTRTLTGSPADPALHVGDKVSLQGNIWTTNPKAALGLDYQNVQYRGPLGLMNAWLVSGSNTAHWTIGVHGIGGNKGEMLRFIPAVHAASNTMLVINYRNDPGNPKSSDSHIHLGDTEWQDLAAAVRYARAHGATTISLYGDSLGGSIVENYLRRSPDAAHANINKVVLDSPALNWPQVLRAEIHKGGYPSFIYYPGVFVLWLRTGITLSHISTTAAQIKQPTLIMHSSDDPAVPQAASKQIATARPNLVTLVDFGHGGHLRSWNYDPTKYDQAVTGFLAGQ